jgi:hypothetical protein
MTAALHDRAARRFDQLGPFVFMIAVLAACATYANLAYRVTDPADYRYFPPFIRGHNANDNGHLGAEYFNIAKALASGRGFSDPFREQTGPTAWMPPVLPLIEGGLLWAADGDKDDVITCVIVLQVFALAVTGALVLHVFAPRTRIGAWAVAFVFLVMVISNFQLWFQFTHDCWLVLLAMDVLILGLTAFPPVIDRGLNTTVAWGLFGGLGALVSPIVGFVWGTMTAVTTFSEFRRLRFRLGLTVAAAGLALVPWTVRNYLIFGRVIPVKSNINYELYQSQCLQRDGLLQTPTFRKHPVADVTGSRREYKQLGEMAFLDAKGAAFRQAVADDPMEFLDRVASRFLGATVWYVPMNRDEDAKRPWTFLWCRIIHPLPFVGFVVLILSSARRPLSRAQWAVIGVYVLYLFPYVVVSYYERYAVPLLATKTLLVTWGVERLATVWYKKGIVVARRSPDATGTKASAVSVPV